MQEQKQMGKLSDLLNQILADEDIWPEFSNTISSET